MAFSGSFPAKTVDLGAIAIAYTVEVADAFRGADYVRKTPLKSVKDSGKGADAFSKTATFHVSVRDSGKSADVLGKTAFYVRMYTDAGKVADWYGKTYSFVRAFTDAGKGLDYASRGVQKSVLDWAVGEHVPAKDIPKALAETIRPADYMCKDASKRFVDVGRSLDYMRKTPSKQLVDAVKSVDWYSKTLSFIRIFADVGKCNEWYVKTSLIFRLFTDILRVADWCSKLMFKFIVDVLKSLDFLEKTPSKQLVDVVRSIDWYSKVLTKQLIDRLKGWDYMPRNFLKVVSDWVAGEFALTRVSGKEIRETPVAVSDRLTKDLTKCFIEFVVARDAPYRAISLALKDEFSGEFTSSKDVSPALRDSSKMADVITKVAYTLAGYDVRRVYAYPKEWRDIIEASDHNTKIEVCKALIEAIKRVREKLGG